MSFSWVEGVPVARVMSGKYSNKKIRYNGDINSKNKIVVSNPFDFITDKWFKERRKKLTAIDLNTLHRCLMTRKEPKDEDLFDLYQQAIEYLEKQAKSEMTIDDGTIQVLPPPEYKVDKDYPKETGRIFVAGPTGSGKSTWVTSYTKEIIKQRRCKHVYIFSNLTEDPVLDSIIPKPKRIKLDENILDPPIALKELKDSVLIFDDIDAIKDDKIRKAVQKLRDEANAEGRHFNIWTLSTAHNLLGYGVTRGMLSDCSNIVFFPRAGGDYYIKQFLSKYCGCGKSEIDKIMTLPSRWVCIKKTYPMMCFYQSGIMLMGHENNKLKQGIIKQKIIEEKEEEKYTDSESDYSDYSE